MPTRLSWSFTSFGTPKIMALALGRTFYPTSGAGCRALLPVEKSAVELAVDGQVGALVGILRGEGFVQIDAESGRVAGVHIAVAEGIMVRENGVGFGGVRHMLLNAEVVDGEAEVQRGGHG